MTDDDKALVERLEEWEWTLRAVYKAGDLGTDEPAIVMGEASDRIEALSAENEQWKVDYNEAALENERLREALVSSTKCLRETASRVGPMHGYWDIIFDNESILKSLGHTK